MKKKYALACYAIVLIVLLRVGIGWHFFYEGVSKLDPASNFTAEWFLGVAKGPPADLFYGMLPDIDGVRRLEVAKVDSINRLAPALDADGVRMVDASGTPMTIPETVPTFIVYENAWREYFKQYLLKYHSSLIKNETDAEEYIGLFVAVQPSGTTNFADWFRERVPAAVAEGIAGMTTAQLVAWSQADIPLTGDASGDDVLTAKALVRAKIIFNRYLNALRADALDFEEEVAALIASRERYLETRRTLRNNTSFEQERRWRQMMGYRLEASYLNWTFAAMGDSLQSELGRLADLELAGRGGNIITAPERELFPELPIVDRFVDIQNFQMDVPEIHIPFSQVPLAGLEDVNIRTRMDAMNWAVIILLTACGFLLIIGLCTRLAALGCAAFLVSVVMTTWPVPGVYPPTSGEVGNFMFVSKDMVELIALLVIAAVPAGRWGGLDYFLWNCGGKQICGLFCPRIRAEHVGMA